MSPNTNTNNNHAFIPASYSDSRSPCPALNALANHGYLPRDGTQIHFTQLLHAVGSVYNLTLPLAFLLTLVGFITCAKFSFSLPSPSSPSHSQSYSRGPHTPPSIPHTLRRILSGIPRIRLTWTLSLAALSQRGWDKIAHDAALTHPSYVPSRAPSPRLLHNFLDFAASSSSSSSSNSPSPSSSFSDSDDARGGRAGLTLRGLARYHAARVRTLSTPLSAWHAQIAEGECALAWLVLVPPSPSSPSSPSSQSQPKALSPAALCSWFGEERLPSAWFCTSDHHDDQGEGAHRPGRAVGIREARRVAGEVGRLSAGSS